MSQLFLIIFGAAPTLITMGYLVTHGRGLSSAESQFYIFVSLPVSALTTLIALVAAGVRTYSSGSDIERRNRGAAAFFALLLVAAIVAERVCNWVAHHH